MTSCRPRLEAMIFMLVHPTVSLSHRFQVDVGRRCLPSFSLASARAQCSRDIRMPGAGGDLRVPDLPGFRRHLGEWLATPRVPCPSC